MDKEKLVTEIINEIKKDAQLGGILHSNKWDDVACRIANLCNLPDVSVSFDSLIDRLERASNIKYPNRQWTALFKAEQKINWKGKEKLLLDRVKRLENEIKIKPMNDIEAVKQHKRIKLKLFLFSVMRSVLYWGICTALIIWMDNEGVVDKYFAWWIGTIMMAIYAKVEFKRD